MMGSMRRVLVVAAVGLALGAGVVPAASAQPHPAIVFDDQRTSGEVLLVDAVQLPDGGFVAVHDPSLAEGGALGPVVGASNLLGPGFHQDVPVTMGTPISEPQPLIAVLYQDTNGNQALDVGDHGHGHEHDAETRDAAYSAGEKTIGDDAEVRPYGESATTTDSVSPLLVGALTSLASLMLWAVRYR
jgi:hypothetical protein